MSKPGQHVVRRGGKWGILKSGSVKVTKIYKSQQEAIAIGRERAKKQGTILYIHDHMGRVCEVESFKFGPFPHAN